MTNELYPMALIRRTVMEIWDDVQPTRVPDRSVEDAGMAVIHHVDVNSAFQRLPDLYKRAIRAELEHYNDLDAMAMDIGTDTNEFKIIIESAYNHLYGLLNDG